MNSFCNSKKQNTREKVGGTILSTLLVQKKLVTRRIDPNDEVRLAPTAQVCDNYRSHLLFIRTKSPAPR